ncbi:MAG TPA: outer membrane beta-barrel protein [Lacipirellula sp.]
MKIRTWRVGIAALALGASPVLAETSGWSYDNNVSGVAFASDCCEPACGCEDSCCDMGCGNACGCAGGLCSDGYLGGLEGLSLASLIGADGSGLEVGGWTEGVYMDNNVPLSQAYNDLLSFDDVPDHFHLGQQWFYLGRAADGHCGPAIGGRVDVMYGTDAQKTQAFGNPNAGVRGFGSWDASLDHGEYGWAIPQAYGEIASGDLSVKVGHFFTPVGYEVIPVTGNFFRSHSYTMYNSEPFTHTGALATYTGFENLTLYSGWSAGWDTGFDQLNSGNTGIGGFSTDLAEDITLTYMSTFGNFGWRDGGSDDSYQHSVVITMSLTQRLEYIFQSDYLRTDNPGVSQYDTIGINQYLIYKINDFVSAGGRAEWWKADGVSFNEVTGGFNFHLLSNLVLRPEIRQDWSPGAGLDEDSFLIDAILTY